MQHKEINTELKKDLLHLMLFPFTATHLLTGGQQQQQPVQCATCPTCPAAPACPAPPSCPTPPPCPTCPPAPQCPPTPFTEISIINQAPAKISDADGQAITNAMNIQLKDFCKEYELNLYQCTYSKEDTTKTFRVYLTVDPTRVMPGAYGYHQTDQNGDIVAYVSVNIMLQNPSVGILMQKNTSSTSIAAIVSHEILEMIMNPYLNKWVSADLPDVPSRTQFVGFSGQPGVPPPSLQPPPLNFLQSNRSGFINAEVSDPVNADVLTVTTNGKQVHLANYVTPAWYGSFRAATGPYDAKNTLKQPFSFAPGGYALFLPSGSPYVFRLLK